MNDNKQPTPQNESTEVLMSASRTQHQSESTPETARNNGNQNRVRSALKTLVGIIILLLIIIGAGASYVWYEGQQPVKTLETETGEQSTPAPLPSPAAPSPNAPVGASIQTLTSPVKAGTNASIAIRTTPTADCTVTVEYNKVLSKDSGLLPKKADAYGTISWTWTVDPNAPDGTWPVKVTCVYNERSAVVQGDQVVKNS